MNNEFERRKKIIFLKGELNPHPLWWYFHYAQKLKFFKIPPWNLEIFYIFKVSPLCMSIGKWNKSWEIKLLLRSILEQCARLNCSPLFKSHPRVGFGINKWLSLLNSILIRYIYFWGVVKKTIFVHECIFMNSCILELSLRPKPEFLV